MSHRKITIGPMRRDFDGDWTADRKNIHLCADSIQDRFNVPKDAVTLWVELTGQQPRHKDAAQVSLDRYGQVKLDNDNGSQYYIVASIRKLARKLGDDFYATIYFKE